MAERSLKRRRQLKHKPAWFNAKQNSLSKRQKKLLSALFSKFGRSYSAEPKLQFHETLDLAELFSRPLAFADDEAEEPPAPPFGAAGSSLTIEIGFGHGDALLPMARSAAARRSGEFFLGIEIHRASLAVVCEALEEGRMRNVRLLGGDAMKMLERHLGDAVADRALVLFPDPWASETSDPREIRWEESRRLVSPRFLGQLRRILKPGGTLHVATDCEDYARAVRHAASVASWRVEADARTSPEEMRRRFGIEDGAAPGPAPVPAPGAAPGPAPGAEPGGGGDFPRPSWRPLTTYERRGVAQGNAIWDMTLAPPAPAGEGGEGEGEGEGGAS